MTLAECEQEKKQLSMIKGIDVSGIGFVCTGGFAFDDSHGLILIDGKGLY
jgi:hypothetical protein